MKREDRKAAVAAYKEQPTAWGVYAVRCSASGEAWVGASNHVDTRRNGLWFGLGQGGSPFRDLQAAWTAHGADAFTFEVLERLPQDMPAFQRKDALEALAERWQVELGAHVLPR